MNKQMLSNKFVVKFDHMKPINNRNLMIFAFDKEKFYNFKIKCHLTFEIGNLTNFLTFLYTKKLFSIFLLHLLHQIYAIWKVFHFYAI